jgi:hypothetical protein
MNQESKEIRLKKIILIAALLPTLAFGQTNRGWDTTEQAYTDMQRAGWQFQMLESKCYALLPKRTEQGKGVGRHAPAPSNEITQARMVQLVQPREDGFCHAQDAIK